MNRRKDTSKIALHLEKKADNDSIYYNLKSRSESKSKQTNEEEDEKTAPSYAVYETSSGTLLAPALHKFWPAQENSTTKEFDKQRASNDCKNYLKNLSEDCTFRDVDDPFFDDSVSTSSVDVSADKPPQNHMIDGTDILTQFYHRQLGDNFIGRMNIRKAASIALQRGDWRVVLAHGRIGVNGEPACHSWCQLADCRLQLIIIYRVMSTLITGHPIRLLPIQQDDDKLYCIGPVNVINPMFATLKQLSHHYQNTTDHLPPFLRCIKREREVFAWWLDDDIYPHGRYCCANNYNISEKN